MWLITLYWLCHLADLVFSGFPTIKLNQLSFYALWKEVLCTGFMIHSLRTMLLRGNLSLHLFFSVIPVCQYRFMSILFYTSQHFFTLLLKLFLLKLPELFRATSVSLKHPSYISRVFCFVSGFVFVFLCVCFLVAFLHLLRSCLSRRSCGIFPDSVLETISPKKVPIPVRD